MDFDITRQMERMRPQWGDYVETMLSFERSPYYSSGFNTQERVDELDRFMNYITALGFGKDCIDWFYYGGDGEDCAYLGFRVASPHIHYNYTIDLAISCRPGYDICLHIHRYRRRKHDPIIEQAIALSPWPVDITSG